MSLTREIEHLYQIPLSAFVAERKALAARAGRESARIKALEKPTASAWAVNQIYWRERRAYDTLVRAATRSRTAHAHALSGKKADLQTLDRQHDAAVHEAARLARVMLQQAGDAATDPTMTAVVETLRSLPVEGEPGLLTRPVQMVGFAAFGDMLRSAAASPREPAELLTFKPSKTSAADRREADRSRREHEAAAARAREIRATQRAAEAALARAKSRLAKVEHDRRDLRSRLEAADAAIDQLRAEIARLDGEVESVKREARE